MRSIYGCMFVILFTGYIILANEIDPEEYLRSYGYINEEDTNDGLLSLMSPSERKKVREKSIEAYQRSKGLKVTGMTDNATKVSMARPRCDVADSSIRHESSSMYSPASHIWDKKLRTYSIRSLASYDQMTRSSQKSIIDDAFHEWSKYIPITFEKVCETCPADIVISFIDDTLGQHFDGNQKTDFRSTTTLAHASFPWNNYPAFIHFNKQVEFTETFDPTQSAKNFFHVALHEIGHVLGLEHIPNDHSSVMYSDYLNLNVTRKDYLSRVDQGYIQTRYGKRETGVINSCSRWSSKAEYLIINKKNSIDKFLTDFIRKQGQWRSIALNRIHRGQISNQFKNYEQLSNVNNKFKTSGRLIENEQEDIVIFFDESDNLYVSDFSSNQILKYEKTKDKQLKTIIAENLNAPRAIYVTNDIPMIYVVDNKGVHRFKLDRNNSNGGAAPLLFQLQSSSEINNMIVDEKDFYTIYLYDISQQIIQQCRSQINTWICKKIIKLTKNDYDLIKQSTMLFDHEGNLLFIDESGSNIVLYKHLKNACQKTTNIGTVKPKPTRKPIRSRVLKTTTPTIPTRPSNTHRNWIQSINNNTIFILECKETIKVLDSRMHTVDYNGNNNQKWLFIQQLDGNYLIKNLAMPVVLNADNKRIYMSPYIKHKNSQKWKLIRQNDGNYLIENVLYKHILSSHTDDGITNQKWFLQNPSLSPYDSMIAILQNKKSNQVLVSNYTKHVYSYKYNGNNYQKWIFKRQIDGSYIIRNLVTSFQLDAKRNELTTEYFRDYDEQKWLIYKQQDGSYQLENRVNKNIFSMDSFWFFQSPSLQPYDSMIVSIRNKKSNQVLVHYNGKSLHIYDYDGSSNQKWKFIQYDNDYYVIENVETRFVLESDDSYVYGSDFDEKDSQKWEIIRQMEGSYILRNQVNSYALSSDAYSTVYPQSDYTNDYQKWFLESI